MKAMVLAAGQGTRLRPLTDTIPKALVPVAGRPMIEYSLLLLRHYGIGDIVINLHHHGEQIEKRLGDGSQLGLKISYSVEPELLDTGGGLLKAKPFFQNDTFIVINTEGPQPHWFYDLTRRPTSMDPWISISTDAIAGSLIPPYRFTPTAQLAS